MRRPSSDDSNSLYTSAITGAYFAIFNAVLAFIPLINAVNTQTKLFIFYIVSGIIILGMNLIIILTYQKNYNYSFPSLRYLYFTGCLTIAFYTGLYTKLLIKFGMSFSNLLIVILLYSLIIMASFDMIKSAHMGMIRMRTLYLRTIGNQYFKNILTILLGIIIGGALIIPFILYS